jgi:alkanesulfonate monooxygenase SsuD/methylene tetrahydromethanopterin reductase-like flavin-dependent oxidoreductase (luciferase family)
VGHPLQYPDLKFGIYLAPRYPPHEILAATLQRELQLIELLDELGYDYAWIGEQHSAGSDIITSTEEFIAAAAARTTSIKLGAGVSRLPSDDSLMSTEGMFPISLASQVSPAGASVAGIHGLELLSLSATSPGGFNALAATWEIYERKARQHQQPVNRSHWSLAGPVHIAETREQAFDNIRFGIDTWLDYFREVAAPGIVPNGVDTDGPQALVDSGMAVIGTAEDAIEQLSRLQKQSGGFGTFLQMAHHWADWEQTRKSYQLFARHVAPVFQNADNPAATLKQTDDNKKDKSRKRGKKACN